MSVGITSSRFPLRELDSVLHGWHADAGAVSQLLIDCAGWPGGKSALPTRHFEAIESLYGGELAEEVEEVGPYLAQVTLWSADALHVARSLLEQQAAVLLRPKAADRDPYFVFRETRNHLRKYNVVYASDGKPMLFRYFDPRALKLVAECLDRGRFLEMFAPFAGVYVPEGADMSDLMQRKAPDDPC